MIKKTMYVADDGNAFDNEEECLEYEASTKFSDLLQSITFFSEGGKVIDFGNNISNFDKALNDAVFVLIPSYLKDERIKYFSDVLISALCSKLFATTTGIYRWDDYNEEWISFKTETQKIIDKWEPMLNVTITAKRR